MRGKEERNKKARNFSTINKNAESAIPLAHIVDSKYLSRS